jgi:hypothetical protein
MEEKMNNQSLNRSTISTKLCSINRPSNQSNKKMTTFVWLNMFSLGFFDGVQSDDIVGSTTPNSTMLLIKSIRRRRRK